MDKESKGAKVGRWARDFAGEIARSPEPGYLALFSLFIFSFYLRRINWIPAIAQAIPQVWLVLFSAMLWGAAGYLFWVFYRWKAFARSLPRLLIALAGLAGITMALARVMTSDQYMLVMDVYFCLMARGKRYRRVLQCYLIVAAATLAIAALGLPLGYATEVVKPDNASPGRSFGIIYPNDWGHIAFLMLLVVWYLYLRGRRAATFAAFWGVALFMFFVVSCRTIALLALLFPAAALAVERLRPRGSGKGARALLTAVPVIAFALSLLLAWQMEWVHGRFYNTPLHTVAMRFVQGGIAMRYFGFHALGRQMVVVGGASAVLNGENVALTVMDNAYISYSITRGLVWMAGCLAWFCLANFRCHKRRDYRLLLIGGFMAVFAMMEWAGLNVWYNFLLIYPLARVGETEE